MNIIVYILLAVVLQISFALHPNHHPQENIVNVKQGVGAGGLWKEKTQWKAHWVKHWEIRKIYVPVWRKIWGPIEVKEWIPFPEPPAEWTSEPLHH